MAVSGPPPGPGDQRPLVAAAEAMLTKAPEMALVFARRALSPSGPDTTAGGADAGAPGHGRAAAAPESAGQVEDAEPRGRPGGPVMAAARAVEVSALVRLGRHAEAVEPAIAVLFGGELTEGAAARVRIDLASCARHCGAPRVALTILRPVLESEQAPSVRADALVQYAACLACLDRRRGVEGLLAEADRLLAADQRLDADTRRVRRALVCVRSAAHQRYHGDTRLALAAAREGLTLLDRLTDPCVDGGLARPRLVGEIVLALLDDGDRDAAVELAATLTGMPARTTSAMAVGMVMLAVATRVHLPAGRTEAGRALLADAVRLGRRYEAYPLLAEALTSLAEVDEQQDRLASALDCLRGARAAETTQRLAVERARSLLADAFGVGEAVPAEPHAQTERVPAPRRRPPQPHQPQPHQPEPTGQTRPADRSHASEQPHAVGQVGGAEPPWAAEQPSAQEQPRAVEQARAVGQAGAVEQARVVERARVTEQSRAEELPRVVEQLGAEDKPSAGEKPAAKPSYEELRRSTMDALRALTSETPSWPFAEEGRQPAPAGAAESPPGGRPARDLLAERQVNVGGGGRRRAPEPVGSVPQPPEPDDYPTAPEPDDYPTVPEPDTYPTPAAPDPDEPPDRPGKRRKKEDPDVLPPPGSHLTQNTQDNPGRRRKPDDAGAVPAWQQALDEPATGRRYRYTDPAAGEPPSFTASTWAEGAVAGAGGRRRKPDPAEEPATGGRRRKPDEPTDLRDTRDTRGTGGAGAGAGAGAAVFGPLPRPPDLPHHHRSAQLPPEPLVPPSLTPPSLAPPSLALPEPPPPPPSLTSRGGTGEPRSDAGLAELLAEAMVAYQSGQDEESGRHRSPEWTPLDADGTHG